MRVCARCVSNFCGHKWSTRWATLGARAVGGYKLGYFGCRRQQALEGQRCWAGLSRRWCGELDGRFCATLACVPNMLTNRLTNRLTPPGQSDPYERREGSRSDVDRRVGSGVEGVSLLRGQGAQETALRGGICGGNGGLSGGHVGLLRLDVTQARARHALVLKEGHWAVHNGGARVPSTGIITYQWPSLSSSDSDSSSSFKSCLSVAASGAGAGAGASDGTAHPTMLMKGLGGEKCGAGCPPSSDSVSVFSLCSESLPQHPLQSHWHPRSSALGLSKKQSSQKMELSA
eukprot:7391638-Prymnesium_polylepis.4